MKPCLEGPIVRLFAELIPSLGLGFWIGRIKPEWTQALARPLVRFGVPLSVIGLLLKSGVNGDLLATALIAMAAIASWMLALQALPPRLRPVQTPTLQIGCVLGNTAYFGIPVALALLPSHALPMSIGYDLGATLLAWSLGPFWLQRQAGGLRELCSHLGASPATRGLIGALIVQTTPWREAIASSLWLPSRIIIILALVVVGMRLGALQQLQVAQATRLESARHRSAWGERPMALLGKLTLFPAWVWLIGQLLPLEPVMRQALVLQGAAPAAISVLLMAEQAGKDADLAAQLILRSTVIALFSVPLWWWITQKTLFGTP